jgi:heat shock protein HslJ
MKRFLLLSLLALSAAACETIGGEAASGAPGAASLAGTEWLLADLSGAGIAETVRSTLAFAEPGRVGGSGGCNRFGGQVRFDGASVQFVGLVTTRRACTPAVMDQERRYLAALERVDRLATDGPHLLAYPKDAVSPLRFTRLK